MTKDGPLDASEHGELLVAEIRYKHQSRRMRDRERQLRRGDHRLRGHAAGPENRNLVGFHRGRIAVVRFGEILDADRMGMAEVNRRAMHRWEWGRDLHPAEGV